MSNLILNNNVPRSVASWESFSIRTRSEDDGQDSHEACKAFKKACERARAASVTKNVRKFGLGQPSKMDLRGDRVGSVGCCVVEQTLYDVQTQASLHIATSPARSSIREELFERYESRFAAVKCEDAAYAVIPSQKAPPEILEHVQEKHIGRTLVVQGITALGMDSLGILRKYFSRFGAVELVIEPRLARAQGLAIVRVEDVATMHEVMALGESHSIGPCSLIVQRIDALDMA